MTGASVWLLAKRTFAAWSDDKAPRLAAALALYTMLSLAPLLVITIKIVGLALDDEAATNQVKTSVQDFTGPEAGQAIQDMIGKAGQPGEGRWATFVSSVLLVVGATALFASIQDALNTVWGVKPRPGRGVRATLHARLGSLFIVIVVGALLLASAVFSNVLQALVDDSGGAAVALGYAVDLILSLAVTTVLFALIFKFLPDVVLEWPDVWLGAAVTAVLFAIGKYGLTLYFIKAAPASAFGAAGSLAALLLWVYYSGMIALFGAEFTKVHFVHQHQRIVPRPYAVSLTPADRATEGIPTTGQVDDILRVEREPQPIALREHRRAGGMFHPASAAIGAILGGLLAWWMGRDRFR